MNTTKTRRQPATKAACNQDIDCEVCRNFSGSGFLSDFKCAKGHAREKSWTFKREQCADFDRMKRDEQILRRFSHHAWFSGDAEIKKRRAEVRRTVTVIRNTITEFGKVMTAAQSEALKTAQVHLAALGDDLELAGRLANRVFEAAEKERQRKEAERRAALEARLVGDQNLVALCDDLEAFHTDGEAWLKARRKTNEAYVQANDYHDLMLWFEAYKIAQLPEEAKANDARRNHYVFALARSNPLAKVREQVRTLAALVMADMEEAGGYASKRANLAEFIAFRAWRQGCKGALDTIANLARGQKRGAA